VLLRSQTSMDMLIGRMDDTDPRRSTRVSWQTADCNAAFYK
jgi:hypothetical protein